jgi:hypothetical protein
MIKKEAFAHLSRRGIGSTYPDNVHDKRDVVEIR